MTDSTSNIRRLPMPARRVSRLREVDTPGADFDPFAEHEASPTSGLTLARHELVAAVGLDIYDELQQAFGSDMICARVWAQMREGKRSRTLDLEGLGLTPEQIERAFAQRIPRSIDSNAGSAIAGGAGGFGIC